MIDEIITAVYRKNYNELKKLITGGANLNETDEDGSNALMHAILAEDADTKMVRFLIDAGIDVKTHDGDQKWTALHFAARDQLQDIVEILLENGADPNAVECFGNTPIARCLNVSPPNLNIIKLLLKHGAEPNKKNNYDQSPIDTAKLTGDEELLKVLRKEN